MSKFIGSNQPCLKWEKAIFDIPSLSKDIYHLQTYFEPDRIFLFKRNPDQDHTSHWGQIREDKSEREGLEQKSNVWERAKRKKT